MPLRLCGGPNIGGTFGPVNRHAPPQPLAIPSKLLNNSGMEKLIELALFALAPGFGGYFGACRKKKGENLATHEDIDKLVTQVSAVTQTIEEIIKAEISDEVWRRQKHWELKKEVLFEATRKLRALEEMLVSLQTLYQVKEKYDSGKFMERTKEEFVHWRKASEEFKQAALLVGIVCGKELSDVCATFSGIARDGASEIMREDLSAYRQRLPELARQSVHITTAIRRELDVG
jgi:hypothetical protein